MAFLLLLGLWWLVFGLMGATLGERKGMKWDGFATGFLFGPVGLLWVYLLRGDRRNCPACQELIAPNAVVCPWCHTRDLPPMQSLAGQSRAVMILLLAILAVIILYAAVMSWLAVRGG